jgi:S1-C subfamily serine protease
MLALLLAAALLPASSNNSHAVAIAQATTVSINASITMRKLLDEDGNPTDFGETETKVQNVCSGWVAYAQPSYAIVVTARHCTIPETMRIFDTPVMTATPTLLHVNFKDGSTAEIAGVYTPSDNDDIAFLTVKTAKQRPNAFLAPALPAQGDDLFVYGMPLGQAFALSPAVMMQDHVLWTDPEGEYANVAILASNSYMIACSACGAGDSGGPVFNRSGQVVGILNAQGDAAQALMYPLEKMRAFLRTVAPVAVL